MNAFLRKKSDVEISFYLLELDPSFDESQDDIRI